MVVLRVGSTAVAVSRDGKVIALVGADRRWERPTGAPVGRPLANYGAFGYRIALSTDGTFLGEALVDGRLQVLPSDAHAWREHACRIAGRTLTLLEGPATPRTTQLEPGPSRTSGEHHIDLFWLPVLAELLTAVR